MSDNGFMGIVEVEDTSPSNVPTTFTRASILLGPDWRWTTAQVEEYSDRNNLVYIPSTDIYVNTAKQMQRMLATRNSKIWFNAKWGSAYDIIHIGIDSAYNTMRTALESAIIRYMGDTEKILNKVKWIQPDQLRLYMNLFFDITGVTAAHDWMEDHVFKPTQKRRSSSAQIALLSAYYSKVATDPTGRMRSKDECSVLHTLMDNTRLRKVAEYVLGDTKIPIEMYAGMMESALKDIDLKRSQDSSGDKETQLSQEIIGKLKDLTKRMEPEEVETATKNNISGIEIDDEMTYIRNRLSGKGDSN